MKTRGLLLLSLAFAAACATVGREFDTTHANDVKKGAHDKAQVEQWFGPPHTRVAPLQNNPNGCVERWQWTHAHAVAGGSARTQVLVVDFGPDGKVCDNAFTSLNK
jgi:hypothetical protein